MSAHLEREVISPSEKKLLLLEKWHKTVSEVQEKTGSLNVKSKVRIVGLAPHLIRNAIKVDQENKSCNNRRNTLIIITIALVVFAVFGAWLLSPSTLIVGAIILSLTSPSLVVALVLWGITSSEATKTKAKYKKIVVVLANQHWQAVKQLWDTKVMPLIKNPGAVHSRVSAIISEQIDTVGIWKNMEKEEVKGAFRDSPFRNAVLRNWHEIQERAKHLKVHGSSSPT